MNSQPEKRLPPPPPFATVPPCPKCGTAKQARPNGHRMFYCSRCEMLYDDSPDDGTVTYGDPSRIAERNERHAQGRRNQTQTDKTPRHATRRY